jgi:hypothetical protein
MVNTRKAYRWLTFAGLAVGAAGLLFLIVEFVAVLALGSAALALTRSPLQAIAPVAIGVGLGCTVLGVITRPR